MTLTGRTALLAALGALVVGIAAPSWAGVVAVEAVLAVLVGVDLALAGNVRKLRFSRTGDASVRLGGEAEVVLTVTNPGRRPVRGLLRDAWEPSAGPLETRFPLAVPAGERRRITVTLQPLRRGDRYARQVTVRSAGPMGLAARQGTHRGGTAGWRLRVLPPFTSRKHLPSRLARLRELDGRAAVLIRGQGTEFDSLRDYVDGDDARSVDWRATARRSTVVVRTWRPERDRHVLVVLDTGRASASRVGDAPRLDAAMDAALLLAALAVRAGDRVDLLAYDRRVKASVRGSAPQEVLPAFVNAMAPLEAELIELDVTGLATTVLSRVRHRALVVLLTTIEPAVLEDGLLRVLPQLTRRHEVVVASVNDPRIAELALAAHPEPGSGTAMDIDDVYGAASAERALAERRRGAELLSRHGATVVDALPEELAPRLADTYLALKLAGRL